MCINFRPLVRRHEIQVAVRVEVDRRDARRVLTDRQPLEDRETGVAVVFEEDDIRGRPDRRREVIVTVSLEVPARPAESANALGDADVQTVTLAPLVERKEDILPLAAHFLAEFAEEEGLIVRGLYGDVVAVCPPLIITEAEIDALFDRLSAALDRAEAYVVKEDLRAQ